MFEGVKGKELGQDLGRNIFSLIRAVRCRALHFHHVCLLMKKDHFELLDFSLLFRSATRINKHVDKTVDGHYLVETNNNI